MESVRAIVYVFHFNRLALALASAGPSEDHVFRTSTGTTSHHDNKTGQSKAWAHLSLVKVHADPNIYNEQGDSFRRALCEL
jgi:hypothetical protein